MRLFEYQAKSILSQNEFQIPKSFLVNTQTDIQGAVNAVGTPFVAKVQTLIGGRGKAGGIKLFDTVPPAEQWCNEKIGTFINGKKVEKILIEEAVPIESEYYVAFSLDTQDREIKFLFSASGGVDIEDATNQLFTYVVSLEYGIDDFRLLEILSRANVPKNRWSELICVVHKLYEVFIKYDCSLLEINPIVWTKNEQLVIVDIHMYIDDNSIPRHPFLKQIINEMPNVYPQNWYKTNHGFDTVMLNPAGSVGLITTGAGLTMATIDALQELTIQPINFCDIRSGQLKGDPTRLIVLLEALKKVPTLKCIFVSIFAGITDLAEFVETLLKAKNQVNLPESVDWVIRLEGNNFEKARVLLEANNIFVTNSLETAIKRIEKDVVLN